MPDSRLFLTHPAYGCKIYWEENGQINIFNLCSSLKVDAETIVRVIINQVR